MKELCRFGGASFVVESGAPPDPQEMARMGALIDEMTRAGTLISTEGCKTSSKGARVRQAGGRVTVTDGPFTEAIELTRKFLTVAGDGIVEVRELYVESDFAPQ